MDVSKRSSSSSKVKKGNNLITKTWERCKSIGKSSSSGVNRHNLRFKSKSWSHSLMDARLEEEKEDKRSRKRRVAPEGCFTVYVGPQRQRFVIKTESVNHPLFKILLEEAESEYGFHSEGPLVLPCNVDVFYKVLLAIDDHGDDDDDDDDQIRQRCGFAAPKRYGSYRLLSPSRMIAINQF